ncbi:MAG TPA: hypothetical protein VGO58_15190, partial [Chitinophagaceae bacterium]|nr:hypothetical protein [Chitinophagaceae bacterium]
MKRIYILLMMIFAVSGVWGQINITSTGTPFTENFDAMLGTSATATLTANQWRAASNTGGTTWAGANLFATTQSGGTAVAVTAGGFYNYGNGIAASATDRALGFLSSGTAPWPGTSATPLSIYAQYTNATGATIAQFDGSFDIEKYRNGTNAQGFNILFYYSLDGNTWTVVGSASQNFPFNANNNAVNPATTTPRTFSISGLNIANGANFYLRWSYFVAAGVTATNAQGLGIDNISVTATGVIAGTPDIALSSPDPAVPSGNIVPGTGGNAIYRFDLAVTTVPANLTGISITTAGTHTAADLTQLRAYYSTDAVFDASDILLAIILAPGGPGAKSFNGFNRAIPDGTTGYIFISAHLACGATLGNTISVNAIAIADITFSSGNKTGSAFAGDAQTVIGVPPNNVTGAAASNGDQQSSVSWTNPVACYDEVLIVAATSANSGVPTGDGTAYTGDLVYGNGTPLGNGFVVYKGNASPQVVTALMNGTTYFFKIFGRFGTNWNSGVEVTATPTVPVITTYTWTGAGSWSTPGNWTPTRTSPAATDIIVFDGIGGTVTGVPTQTIGKL